MPLADINFFRDTFLIHKDVEDDRIQPYFAVASRRVQTWVSAEIYADSDYTALLRLAEATLVMHYLITNLNTAVRTQGLVKTERVEGNVTLEYLTPAQAEALEITYLNRAEEIIRDITSLAENPPTVEEISDDV